LASGQLFRGLQPPPLLERHCPPIAAAFCLSLNGSGHIGRGADADSTEKGEGDFSGHVRKKLPLLGHFSPFFGEHACFQVAQILKYVSFCPLFEKFIPSGLAYISTTL